MNTNESSASVRPVRSAIIKAKLPEVVPPRPIPVGGSGESTSPATGSIRLIRKDNVVQTIEYHCQCGHIAHISCDYE